MRKRTLTRFFGLESRVNNAYKRNNIFWPSLAAPPAEKVSTYLVEKYELVLWSPSVSSEFIKPVLDEEKKVLL